MRLQLNFRVQNIGTFSPSGDVAGMCYSVWQSITGYSTQTHWAFQDFCWCVFSFKHTLLFQLTAISSYLASVPGLQLASNGPLCFTVHSTDTKQSHFLKKYLDFWNKNTMLTQSTKLSISLHYVVVQSLALCLRRHVAHPWLRSSDQMLQVVSSPSYKQRGFVLFQLAPLSIGTDYPFISHLSYIFPSKSSLKTYLSDRIETRM